MKRSTRGSYRSQDAQKYMSHLSTNSSSSNGSRTSISNNSGGVGAAIYGSYEQNNIKRTRAGSISGRLRSASDLESTGVITSRQKGLLKDLIISGDDKIQKALDEYEMGDGGKALEEIMGGGGVKGLGGDGIGDLVDRPNLQMIVEVLTHPRQVVVNLNAELAQASGLPYSGYL